MSIDVTATFDDRWLQPYHLDTGPEYVVTITDALIEALPKRQGMPAANRVSLGLARSKRRLLLSSKTNVRTLLALGFGRDAAAWVGRKIVLTVGTFARDPGGKVPRVVIVARDPGASSDDGHAIRDDAEAPAAPPADAGQTGREPGED